MDTEQILQMFGKLDSSRANAIDFPSGVIGGPVSIQMFANGPSRSDLRILLKNLLGCLFGTIRSCNTAIENRFPNRNLFRAKTRWM